MDIIGPAIAVALVVTLLMMLGWVLEEPQTNPPSALPTFDPFFSIKGNQE